MKRILLHFSFIVISSFASRQIITLSYGDTTYMYYWSTPNGSSGFQLKPNLKDGHYKIISKTDTGKFLYIDASYSNNLPSGIWIYYYPSGKIYMQKKYEDGEDKMTIFYYENGNIEYRIYYSGGACILEYTYNENGKIEREVPYKEGSPNGIVKNYDKNGKLISETIYNNGVEGTTKYYDKNGNEIK